MVGELKGTSVNFDRSGRSKGSAEVVFARRADAMTALKRYNGATLDGLPQVADDTSTSRWQAKLGITIKF
jgi:THO complex subunit 4